MGTDHRHRVATYAEAEAAIRARDSVWINDCFCREPAREGREKWSYCGHPVEVCMAFAPPPKDADYAAREIPQREALALHEAWTAEHLPFRFMVDEGWICFCCRCGCRFFRDEDGSFRRDPCDKSPEIQRTDPEACAACGDCVDACAWLARRLEDERLVVAEEDCYGCSACVTACPESAITVVPRAE
jgi:ferredoxin